MLGLLLVAIAMAAVLLPNVVGFLLLSFSQKSQNNQNIKKDDYEKTSFQNSKVLLYKLATRPIVRTVFSVGLGAMFAIFAIFGPPLVFLTQRLNQKSINIKKNF